MGIWLIDEIWAGIRFIITFFMDKSPKTVKFIFFLVFLLFFSAVIVAILHLSGVHCTSAKEPVKVDTLDIGTNLKIYWWSIDDTLNTPVLDIDEALPYNFLKIQDPESACTIFAKNVSGTFEACTNISDTSCKYYYKNAGCHNCDSLDLGWIYDESTLLNWLNLKDVCLDNATRLTEQNWFQRNILCDSSCLIPPNYQWDIDNGRFECINDDFCGLNATFTPDTRIDQELDDAKAVPLYKDKNAKGISNVFLIRCDPELDPRLTFFGIPIFDYRTWLVIFIIAIMFIFLNKIRTH